MSVGGLIGGFGVAAAAGLANRQILSAPKLLGAAMIGLVAAQTFTPWLAGRTFNSPVLSPTEQSALVVPFAIWQAVVGVYIWIFSKRC